MLKVLVITSSADLEVQNYLQVFENLPIKIVAKAAAGAAAVTALQKYKPDLVLSSMQTSTMLNAALQKSDTQPRQSIMASTHQGIQLVPVTDVIYFQAEHKYVIAHHTKGQLLIEDSLTQLEHEFANIFVRIHRNALVAIAKIDKVYRSEDGQHLLNVRDISDPLVISRRQLPQVRKVLLCK